MKMMMQNQAKLLVMVLLVAGLIAMNFAAHAQENEYVTGEIRYQSDGMAAGGLWVEVYLGSMLRGLLPLKLADKNQDIILRIR